MEDFEIITKLGDGSYSTVYKVKRKIDNQIYALKKVKLINLTEKEKSNSLNEVRILASIKSHYVISYKEAFFDEKDSTLGIIMEYADNGDLFQLITEQRKKKQFLEEDVIWKIFIQTVKGLKALHDLKILHRDIKSANIFLFKDGSAKLGDLNVSKVCKKGLGYTQTGTPYYASPEVWKDLPYDNKSDIWSLGCVLYEMISLFPPFRAKTMELLYKRVMKGEISNIPDKFSFDLFEIVNLLIQVNPVKRPSCGEILKNEIIVKKIEYFRDCNNKNNDNFEGDEDDEEQFLLKTIFLPKNLGSLINQLPKPNYTPQKNKNQGKTLTKNFSTIASVNQIDRSKYVLPSIKTDININNNNSNQIYDKINNENKNIIINSNVTKNNNINININNIENVKNYNNINNIRNTVECPLNIKIKNNCENMPKKIYKLHYSADKINPNKIYIINNINKEKILKQINNYNNNNYNYYLAQKKLIPISKNSIQKQNVNNLPSNKNLIGYNLMMASNSSANINNNNKSETNTKNKKLIKIGSQIYPNKIMNNNCLLPVIASHKKEVSYVNNNVGNINNMNKNKGYLCRAIPRCKLNPIKGKSKII